jgi:hypothetical protein
MLLSGNAAFRLLKTPASNASVLHADPGKDHHKIVHDLPNLKGTVVGIDVNIEQGVAFSVLLNAIREAYFSDVKIKKKYANKIRFTR